jgi:hypothetical protein
MAKEYRSSPAVVRERLYRDTVERAVAAAGQVRWIPPPAGSRYSGLRITVTPSGANGSTPEPSTPAGGSEEEH